MSRTKNQHYVPRFYLGNFAVNEQIYVYDKFLSRTYKSNIKNIASETGFYDFSPETVEAVKPELDELLNGVELPDQFLEKELSRMEAFYKPFLQNVVSSVALASPQRLSGPRLVDEDAKFNVAQYIAWQHLRTRDSRERVKQIYEKGSEAILKMIGRVHPDAPKDVDWDELDIELKLSREQELALHMQSIFNDESRNEIAKSLFYNTWILGYNRTERPLYTSDHPVVMRSHIPDKFRGTGITSDGVEVCLPLTDRLVLSIYDKKLFKNSDALDGTLMFLAEANVDYYNSLQVYQSHRQVYAKLDDFKLVEAICARRPDLKDPDRAKIEVSGSGSKKRKKT